jgi:hypothetical protein
VVGPCRRRLRRSAEYRRYVEVGHSLSEAIAKCPFVWDCELEAKTKRMQTYNRCCTESAINNTIDSQTKPTLMVAHHHRQPRLLAPPLGDFHRRILDREALQELEAAIIPGVV